MLYYPKTGKLGKPCPKKMFVFPISSPTIQKTLGVMEVGEKNYPFARQGSKLELQTINLNTAQIHV